MYRSAFDIWVIYLNNVKIFNSMTDFYKLSKNTLSELREFLFFFSFVFLRPHPWHMKVPRLGLQSEL